MKTNATDPQGRRLIWIVTAVVTLQIAVWAAWITFASNHRVAEVPRATTR